MIRHPGFRLAISRASEPVPDPTSRMCQPSSTRANSNRAEARTRLHRPINNSYPAAFTNIRAISYHKRSGKRNEFLEDGRQFGCYAFLCPSADESAHHQLSFKDIWRGSSLQLFEAYNYLGAGVPLFDIRDRVSGVTQSITLIDQRGYFSGLHEFAQCPQIIFFQLRDKERELLA